MGRAEVWKDINGYEGLYKISNLGKIRSLNRTICKTYAHKSFKHKIKERQLKTRIDVNGYEVVDLCKDGKKKRFKIHRLISEAFIPNPFNLPFINHKDENKSNNDIENLEWCTQKYNNNYGTARQRGAEKISQKVYQYKNNDSNLIFVKEWSSSMECKRNGFNHSHIRECCLGQRKSHKGFIWSINPLKGVIESGS